MMVMAMAMLDPHVHSSYSIDGLTPPKDLAKIAEKRKVFIAITDHDCIKGSLVGRRFSKRIILGSEVSTADGHLLALGIDKDVKKGMKAEETVEIIKDQGGVAIAAHPFRLRSGIGKKINSKFDGIEILNARCTKKENEKAIRFYEKRKLNIAKTGGSDCHVVDFLFATYTEVEGETSEEILEAIRRGRTKPMGTEMKRKEVMKQKIYNFFIILERRKV
jgi:Predicted metal-dependent phosphoesterases (PHP family)